MEGYSKIFFLAHIPYHYTKNIIDFIASNYELNSLNL